MYDAAALLMAYAVDTENLNFMTGFLLADCY